MPADDVTKEPAAEASPPGNVRSPTSSGELLPSSATDLGHLDCLIWTFHSPGTPKQCLLPGTCMFSKLQQIITTNGMESTSLARFAILVGQDKHRDFKYHVDTG